MRILYILIVSSFFICDLNAQEVKHLDEIKPQEFKENVTVEKLFSDINQSTYIIWVSDTVKPHYHKTHSECLYVLEGGGTFYLGKQIIELKKGDFILIPMGIIHSFKHKRGRKTKVLSIQTPEFLGKDRIWVDKQE